MSRDQMVMTLLPIMEKCPMDFYQEVVVVTRYKEICQSCNYEVMTSLPPEAEYPMEPFEWGWLAGQIWMFLAS